MKCVKAQSALIENKLTLLQAPYGEPVAAGQKILMRVKPTSFMLNSNIVADVLNRGDVFVTDMASGTFYATKGSTTCKLLDSTLNWSEK